MKGLPEERTIRLAQYIIEENATVRRAAAQFGVSKSTVHKDITTRLQKLNSVLYDGVQQVLRTNKQAWQRGKNIVCGRKKSKIKYKNGCPKRTAKYRIQQHRTAYTRKYSMK